MIPDINNRITVGIRTGRNSRIRWELAPSSAKSFQSNRQINSGEELLALAYAHVQLLGAACRRGFAINKE
jgi:hypothetical protein